MQTKTIINVALATLIGLITPSAICAELNTQLPKEQEDAFSVPLNLDMPVQPLAAALRQFSIQSNLSLTVDSALIVDKKSPAIKGRLKPKDAIKRMLDGTGLQGNIENDKIFIQRAPKAEDKTVQLDRVEVRAKRFYEVGPLPGLGLTKEEIPGNVQSISAKEIKEAHALSLTDLMNRKLQSVTVNDYQGNPFQMDVQYRGFTAGPQIGTPQGLSVFFDGIRVNEPFGDVVNWDMIPMNALASVDVFPGSNPIFGLNTLGGAFATKTKDGFNNAGVDADVLTGSYGRKQLQVEGGWNNGNIALFGAGNFFLEDGWRNNSPSKVNQFFGKASYRGDKLDINLSTLLVGTDLTGNGLLPSEMYARDKNASFTSEDTTKNRLQQFQLSGSYFVTNSFTITGQVYRRNSKRHQKGADAFMGFAEDPSATPARRLPGINPVTGTPEEYTCLFASTNTFGYNIPDYYLLQFNETAGEDFFTPGSRGYDFVQEYLNSGGVIGSSFDDLKNQALKTQDGFSGTPVVDYPSVFERDFNFNRNFTESSRSDRFDPITPAPNFVNPFGVLTPTYGTAGSEIIQNAVNIQPGQNVFDVFNSEQFYFYSTDANNNVIKNVVVFQTPTNVENCASTHATNGIAGDSVNGGLAYTYKDSNGNIVFVDGAAEAGTAPGVVEGTPTSIITDNQINQIVDGASVQFNWNLENHKFMIGASIDAASAEYTNTSQLGLLTADREAYLDPENIHPMFGGALIPLSNNNFEGTQSTKSVYFSETWTPIETVHLSASGRYNLTRTKNKIAARSGFYAFNIGELINTPDEYNLCNGDCSVNPPPTNYRFPRLSNILDPAETEKFSFHSFNPSFGATWQARENLNLFANWSQGTRVPSVIELGCAFDKTPIVTTPASDRDGDGIIDPAITTPKSIYENRTCTLPTTLSGDPYLPQIKATSYDVGMRGTLGENLQWNLNAFQTDLKDDIYFVTVAAGAGFFDTVGKTRRRGIEAGLSGRKDQWGFSLNYSLTDATFQDNFLMLSENNSSAVNLSGYGRVIEVNKGNRMPGVALHNLNATLSYDVTPQWRVGFTAIAHSDSFVRGNENNKHVQGAIRKVIGIDPVTGETIYTPPTTNPGTVPGYATFNFQTSYKFNKEWTGTMLINNVFDREYFTAGRLGRNPFSPSIYGAIGPDGYNHNSNDWLSTNFIAPGAPRGVWFSLNWHFMPD